MITLKVKIAVTVPETHAEAVRGAMASAGAGKIANYTHCTFTTKGIGRFKAGQGANPFIGEVGKIEEVEEEKIETICERESLATVIAAIKKAHPYEELALDIYPLETDRPI